MIFSSGIALFAGIYTGEYVAVGIVLLIMAALVLPMLLSTNYTIDGDVLNIRSGLIKYKAISIAAITRIEKTQSLLSAPAVSLTERIEVFYNRYDSIVISPRNRSAFIADILRVNPDVAVGSGV
jgi:hypothetical protein